MLSDLQNGWTLQTQKTQFVIWHHQLWFSVMLQSVWKIVSLITQPPVECKIWSLSRTKISLFYSGFSATLINIISFFIFITDGRVFRWILSLKSCLLKMWKSPAATHFNNTRRWQSPDQAWIKHGLFAYISQKGGNGSIIPTLRISEFGGWITPCLKGGMSCICKDLTEGWWRCSC